MVEDANNSEPVEGRKASQTNVADASDNIQSYQRTDSPLQAQATDLLYRGPESRANFPSTATTVSLASIDRNGTMEFPRPNYGQFDRSTVADQFDTQVARADFTRKGDVRVDQVGRVRDGADRNLDPKTVNDFKKSMGDLINARPQDAELGKRVDQFFKRVADREIAPDKAESIMRDLTALMNSTKDGKVGPNGIQKPETMKAFVSGLLDNVAQPEKINQTGTNTCNATTVQEQLYKHNPAEAVARARRMAETGEYVAQRVDAKGNRLEGPENSFTAKLPPNFFKTMDQLAKDDQTHDEKLNVATCGVSVGMLNHHYQQRGLYYSIEKGGNELAINRSDTNGEFLAKFENGQFTTEKKKIGSPDTDAYAVADMGRAAGLNGRFVLARAGFANENRQHTGVQFVKSDADIRSALNNLETNHKVNSAIMAFDVGNVFNGERGGHVVSITKTKDNSFRVSDQNENSALEGKIASSENLFAWMKGLGVNEKSATRPRDFLDRKPGKITPHYEQPGVIRADEWKARYGDNPYDRQREQERLQERPQDKRNENPVKKSEEQDPNRKEKEAAKQDGREKVERQQYAQSIRVQIAQLEARLAGLESSTKSSDRAQAHQLTGQVSDLTGQFIRMSA